MIGQDQHIFDPGKQPDERTRDWAILCRHYLLFGPWPEDFKKKDWKTWIVLCYAEDCLRSKLVLTGLHKHDVEFLKRVMKMDPKERPTAEELLKDEWFTEGWGVSNTFAELGLGGMKTVCTGFVLVNL